jgi:MFS transporter, DHA1 family, multidrug resistance protein
MPWQKNLYTLWAAQFLAMVGLTLIVPFIPLFIETLGIRRIEDVERWSGLLFAAPFLAQALAAPLWGVLGDRYGRKIMVIRALGGIGTANLLSSLVQNVQELLVLRTCQGGVSGFVAATNALISASIPRERLGVAMGLLQTSLTAGGVIGPLIGGALSDLVGYRRVFVINGLMCWLAAAVVFRGVRESSRAPARPAGPGVRENFAYFFASPVLRSTGLLLCASQIAVMSVEPIFPLFVSQLGVPAARVATISGFLFSVTGITSILGAPVWGRASDHIGEARVLVVVLVGGCLSYAAQAAVHSALSLLVFRGALGFFVGGLLPPLYAMVARLTPPERLGGMMGVTSSAIMIGSLFGPLLGGLLSSEVGMRPLFLVAAAILGLSAFGTRGLASAARTDISGSGRGSGDRGTERLFHRVERRKDRPDVDEVEGPPQW